MVRSKQPIIRSSGTTPTEKILSKLCDKVFLKLWVYPNPYKKKGNELCDVLVIFEDHVFIFSVKAISFSKEKKIKTSWSRWKSKAVDNSIKQINNAEKSIKAHPDEIFLDAKCENKVPINVDLDNCKIHRIVIAHGAEQACKEFSDENVAGSLAISYSDKVSDEVLPFLVNLPKNKIYHVFDSFNLDIILGELDTIRDFLWYLEAKEAAIKKYDAISYCGEEDLLAHYLYNFDKKKKCHYIGTKKKGYNRIRIGEGEWHDFALTRKYLQKKEEDKVSYSWDELLQRTLQNALNKTLLGNDDVFNGKSALMEMAKEPRFMRRELSKSILNSIKKARDIDGTPRMVSSYPSFYPDRAYIFLQVTPIPTMDYETEYRPSRQAMLRLACGVFKNKCPELKKIIGIGINMPFHENTKEYAEDFILLDCSNWSKEDEDYYNEGNKELKFFETDALQINLQRSYEFPPNKKIPSNKRRVKIGRNDPCPCGSNKKYKKCCLKLK